MSSTANHKKAIAAIIEAKKVKGQLNDVFLQILADQPSAIVNAWEKLRLERHGTSGVSPGYGPWQKKEYKCPDCSKTVSVLGIGGSCGICDPSGMTADIPY